MLTLKHIIWDGAFETLYQAKEVRAKYPEPKISDGPIGGPVFVAFDLPNGEVRQLHFGKVYVMNEAGKTVGKYDMPASRPTYTDFDMAMADGKLFDAHGKEVAFTPT